MLTYKTPSDPAAVVSELAALYGRVFVRNCTEDADHAGLGVVVARDEDTVVGFGYGTARPPEWWWPGCDTPPPPEIMRKPSPRCTNGPSTSRIEVEASVGSPWCDCSPIVQNRGRPSR